jgi:uncharacterized lipoprotein YbaY
MSNPTLKKFSLSFEPVEIKNPQGETLIRAEITQEEKKTFLTVTNQPGVEMTPARMLEVSKLLLSSATFTPQS